MFGTGGEGSGRHGCGGGGEIMGGGGRSHPTSLPHFSQPKPSHVFHVHQVAQAGGGGGLPSSSKWKSGGGGGLRTPKALANLCGSGVGGDEPLDAFLPAFGAPAVRLEAAIAPGASRHATAAAVAIRLFDQERTPCEDIIQIPQSPILLINEEGRPIC